MDRSCVSITGSTYRPKSGRPTNNFTVGNPITVLITTINAVDTTREILYSLNYFAMKSTVFII